MFLSGQAASSGWGDELPSLQFGAVGEVEGVADGGRDLANIVKDFALIVWLEGCDEAG